MTGGVDACVRASDDNSAQKVISNIVLAEHEEKWSLEKNVDL